jgi:hypothetical protein
MAAATAAAPGPGTCEPWADDLRRLCDTLGLHKPVILGSSFVPADPHARSASQIPQAPSGGMPVHPGSPPVEQDRSYYPASDGAVDRPPDGRRQRHEHDLAALAAYPEHPVAVLLAEIFDIGTRGLEDPKSKQAEHRHQREVTLAVRLAGGGQHGLELQVGEPERGRLRRHCRPADMLGRRVIEHAVDHRGAVEPGGDREPPRHRRRLEPAHFLHPADVQLQMHPASCQRIEAALGAPRQEAPQVTVRVIT